MCEALSRSRGIESVLPPHKLFDIIGGVGTGGWLAILLGRYKLTIEQCTTVYIDLARTLDPMLKRPYSARERGPPAALSQARCLYRKLTRLSTRFVLAKLSSSELLLSIHLERLLVVTHSRLV